MYYNGDHCSSGILVSPFFLALHTVFYDVVSYWYTHWMMGYLYRYMQYYLFDFACKQKPTHWLEFQKIVHRRS